MNHLKAMLSRKIRDSRLLEFVVSSLDGAAVMAASHLIGSLDDDYLSRPFIKVMNSCMSLNMRCD